VTAATRSTGTAAQTTAGRSQRKTSGPLALAGCLLLAVLALAAAPWCGSERIDVPAAAAALLRGETSTSERILALRLPRIVLGMLAGGGLALAGATFQTLLRNALATPYTLGVSFAGAFGAFLALSVPALSFSLGPVGSVALFAWVFSALDVAALYALARRPDHLDTHELLLAGVTLNFFFGACILLTRFLTDPQRLRAMDHWMMGGLQVSGWGELVPVPALLLPGAALLLLQARALNQLAFGEELAAARGVEVARTQQIALFAGSMVTAAVVGVTGPIGFVGLIAPHAVRRFTGPDHRWLLPCAFLAGGAFLVLMDAVARELTIAGRGAELPVGILTAMVGAPLFLGLLLRARRAP
jgi:iron complex transport system permease protein